MDSVAHSLLIKQRLHVTTSLLRCMSACPNQQAALLQAACLSLWQAVQCALDGFEQHTPTHPQAAPWCLDIADWRMRNQQHPYAHLFGAPWVLQLEALHAHMYQAEEQRDTLATTALQLTPQLVENMVASFQNCINHITEQQYEC